MGWCDDSITSSTLFSAITTATDGLMTFFDTEYCSYTTKLFYILGGGGYLKIALPTRSTVRTILLSAREYNGWNDGIKISVGDVYPGTLCSTPLSNGKSSWLTCNEGFGLEG